MTWALLAQRLAGWLAPVLAGAGAVLALLYAGRRQGRQEAERRALGRDLENRRTRDAVERDVARRPNPTGELLRDWRRD